jgi:hypothetical protein
MDGVGTSIIGRPRPSPRHRHAHSYTLECEGALYPNKLMHPISSGNCPTAWLIGCA